MAITIPYKPRYPEVHKALETHRFAVLVAHRRFGKTVLAIIHLIKSALSCQKIKGHFGYIAPFRNQAKSVAWDYLKYYTRVIPKVKIMENELAIILPTKKSESKIRIFGADNPDSLRGLYFDGVVLDEVAQMKPQVWEETVQPCLADRQGFAVFIGTPKGINLFSSIYFHALQEQGKPDAQWTALSYPCTATNALPQTEIERLRKELSENKFRQEMLCDFTASSDDVLINVDLVNGALNGKIDLELNEHWPLVLGVDVARFGADATVFFPRRGKLALHAISFYQKSNTDIAMRLVNLINELKIQYVNIDQGQGTGVIDIARDLAPPGCVISEVPFGGAANNPKKFANRRAEMWHNLRDWLKEGGMINQDENSEIIKAELSSPCYGFDASGRIKLEAKEEIKKRLGHSTDFGDALALTFAFPVSGYRAPSNANTFYDPFK